MVSSATDGPRGWFTPPAGRVSGTGIQPLCLYPSLPNPDGGEPVRSRGRASSRWMGGPIRTFGSGIRSTTMGCWDLCQDLPLLINPLSGKISHIPTKYIHRNSGLPSSHWSQLPSGEDEATQMPDCEGLWLQASTNPDPPSAWPNYQVSRSRESNERVLTRGPGATQQSHFLRCRGSPKGNPRLQASIP